MTDTAALPATNGGSSSGPATSKPETTKTSTTPVAADEPLTHYHSFFSELLSWNNPRTTGIAFASTLTFIFAVRYLDVIRWSLKLTWMLLGATIAAEGAGKLVLSKGLVSQIRPRKYYTLPRETLDKITGDIHDLLNFFVIEAQRVLYVENIYVSASACIATFLAYYLVKIVPYWGLALITTMGAFLGPLVYKTNKELIDAQLKQVSDVVDAQTSQLREAANKHTAHATELTKQYMGDYTAKAQQMISSRVASVKATSVASAPAAPTTEPVKKYEATDFPAAPKAEPETEATAAAKSTEEEPLIAA